MFVMSREEGVSGFSGMGIVERWNGGIDACVVSSTFLVHACWQ